MTYVVFIYSFIQMIKGRQLLLTYHHQKDKRTPKITQRIKTYNRISINTKSNFQTAEPLRLAERSNCFKLHLNAGRDEEERKAGGRALNASTLLKKELIKADL
jgi:hypothetical protein